ncbi:hypothetical protein KMW28_12375 [Flammeovirga yaeyamensis]|uniref:Tail specific protease domain-containing protein n=1 Tax=Flammeovirga yaeyamensis TaxID=367791 RepID=A0AAX1MYN4_9BACT|nr:S41 family peptidase [Flammeovirga yaeyamensis]MBB3696036.1 C-terminal processing protease CtpA/Prc [Flammeovirga yaeyamensis]NMF34722.1 hypothetical protein [Flammeovirga yaeyamensis]QWG00449.1 hypothetical protein KMW28_12375 [Flammeovirga yaeyamensis]
MKKLLTLLFSLSFTFSYAQHKIKGEKLLEDFDTLVSELRLQHQGLYNYTDKSDTDSILDSIRNTLKNGKTYLEFYEDTRLVIGLTNEGHTSIDLPKKQLIKLGLSKSFLPLKVKFCDDHLMVVQNYGKEILDLKQGTEILSVNGRSIDEICNKIYPLIPSDGFNVTSKNEWVGGIIFSLLNRLAYGKSKNFVLEVKKLDSSIIKKIDLKPVRLSRFKTKNALYPKIDFDYKHFVFEQINDSIAYMSIPTLGTDSIDYAQTYQSYFSKVDSLNIKHLIIDVQENGGGTEGKENLLFSYLYHDVFQKYKRITMLPKPYEINKEDEDYIEDKWALKGDTAYRGDYTLMSDYYSNLGFKHPKEHLIYDGKVYVLISGKTFSGGAEFSSLVKMTNRGLFIGEETGGTYEGNVSGYAEYVTLPNTKIEVNIPTVHFQMKVNPKERGRGVLPDYRVPEKPQDYLNGVNTKKEFAIQLILNSKASEL